VLNNIVGLLDAGFAASTNSYESIATQTAAGGETSFTFSSIPSTYKHLQIRSIFKPSAVAWLAARFNSDTGNNYSYHSMRGNGSTATSEASTSTNFMLLNLYLPTPATNVFGVGVTDILDYTNTSKYTTVRALGGTDANGSGSVDFASDSWRNTAAVTSITLSTNNGSTFAQYSSFALYGIKG
jgi:hypothetical protein